jgi:hypothetical protein
VEVWWAEAARSPQTTGSAEFRKVSNSMVFQNAPDVQPDEASYTVEEALERIDELNRRDPDDDDFGNDWADESYWQWRK